MTAPAKYKKQSSDSEPSFISSGKAMQQHKVEKQQLQEPDDNSPGKVHKEDLSKCPNAF
jgi:hypothetical protein